MFERDLLDRSLALGTATLYEAAGLTTAAVDPAIRPVWPGATVAGPAFTVECAPGDNLGIHLALERAPRGAVLVVDARGAIVGYWGEVLTVFAEARGIAGLVIDGGVRDTAALQQRRFPAFARGISVRGTRKLSVPSVGKPLLLAGTPVATGDLVVGDGDGVVVIPADVATAVVARGTARAAKEAAWMARLAEGDTTLDLLGLSEWRGLA